MKRKVIFLHGFFASGACTPAQALQESLSNKAQVLTPDLPLHPREALSFLRQLCQQEAPDVLVGNSNGSFLAQIIASENGLPALLGIPFFEMTKFLTERIGPHEYKSPRADGNQHFVIDQPLIDEFAEVQLHQWDHYQSANREHIWGIFGENAHLAHYEPLFLKYYPHSWHFPGGHTPTADEVHQYYVPLIEKLLTI